METKNVNVTHMMGHPACACVFIFASITACFWAAYSGWIPAESQALSMGVMQVTLYPAWLACAIVMLKLGDALNGCIFAIFASLFGLMGGALNIATYITTATGNPTAVSPLVGAIVYCVSGIVLIPATIGAARGPLAFFLIYGVSVIFLVMQPFSAAGLLGPWCYVAYKWMALIIIICAVLGACNAMAQMSGLKGFYLGPALIKDKTAE